MTTSFITDFQQRIESVLGSFLLAEQQMPQRLHQAMRYVTLNGGKRIRPLLVYASGQLAQIDLIKLDAAAAAVEMIHCYSLVHDDLPAMDNDDLRRGKPTCHKAFDQATAILAGDAIQAGAFAVIANDDNNDNEKRVNMLKILANACGSLGMAGGQALDLAATGQQINLEQLKTMHQMKTGALIKASVLLGAVAADIELDAYQQLAQFAELIGLAFQIHDDILDVEADTETLGKQQGADIALNKVTYPALVGIDSAKQMENETYHAALAALNNFGDEAGKLRDLAAYIIQRNY